MCVAAIANGEVSTCLSAVEMASATPAPQVVTSASVVVSEDEHEDRLSVPNPKYGAQKAETLLKDVNIPRFRIRGKTTLAGYTRLVEKRRRMREVKKKPSAKPKSRKVQIAEKLEKKRWEDKIPIGLPARCVYRKQGATRPAETYVIDCAKKYVIGSTERAISGHRKQIEHICALINEKKIKNRCEAQLHLKPIE